MKNEYVQSGRKRSKRSSFFNSWEKYTEAENDEYCRLNNRMVNSEPKNVIIIDLDEYEELQLKQEIKSKQRASKGTIYTIMWLQGPTKRSLNGPTNFLFFFQIMIVRMTHKIRPWI